MKTEDRANTLGGRIKAAREGMGMSQTQLADALGFKSPTAVSLIENGERGVAASLLARIAHILHQDVNYLLGAEIKTPDIKLALRADKDLSDDDKNAILRFIELAKKKPDAK